MLCCGTIHVCRVRCCDPVQQRFLTVLYADSKYIIIYLKNRACLVLDDLLPVGVFDPGGEPFLRLAANRRRILQRQRGLLLGFQHLDFFGIRDSRVMAMA